MLQHVNCEGSVVTSSRMAGLAGLAHSFCFDAVLHVEKVLQSEGRA